MAFGKKYKRRQLKKRLEEKDELIKILKRQKTFLKQLENKIN